MVVMPDYLKMSSKQQDSKPRIISEVKKNCLNKLKLNFTTSLQDFGKSKFSGQLLWNRETSNWVLTIGEVRQGSLIILNKESLIAELRLPLREMNLRPCSGPRTFCLEEAKGLGLLVFQAPTDEEYEKWVRILAVELIRQTPLQNVRFLDILSIIRHKETSDGECLRRGRSAECMIQPQEKPWATCPSPSRKEYPGDLMKKPEIVGEIRKMKVCGQNSLPTVTEIQNKWETNWMRTQSMNNLASPVSDESGISSGDEIPAESSSFSISRDVDDFSFLSVRERKKFFESLNVADEQGLKWTSEPLPLSRSNSIGNLKISFWQDKNKLRKRKRTKSLHDLHKTPVREICQLFESRDAGVRKGETEVEAEPEEEVTNNAIVVLTERRLQRGERKLEKLRNQITEVEESIAAISADLKAVKWKNLTGQKGLDLHLALHRRLDDERCRLERLMEEATRIIKGNQRVILKLERSNEKSPRTV